MKKQRILTFMYIYKDRIFEKTVKSKINIAQYYKQFVHDCKKSVDYD